ncbi:Protein of unknown function (DUF664) [Prauserella sp. Am3]|nr:Protein of unknown function (DUF664) [Prauserella sp. Am3]
MNAVSTTSSGAPESAKATLRRYLQQAREAMLWKLDGVTEYDARRPLTPTGTNLLGLVKHVAGVEFGYLSEVFGYGEGAPGWLDGSDPDPQVDMWARPDETREDVVALYRTAWANTDAAIAELTLDTVGRVPHWPDARNPVTFQQILVHLVAETHRHAGHADILREGIDGAAGYTPSATNLPQWDDNDGGWPAYIAKLEQVAARFRD